MSDPLSRLSSLGAGVDAPDLDAIKLRAHRLRRRRQTSVAAAGASALAVLAVVGVLLATGPGAERKEGATSLSEALDSASPAPTQGRPLAVRVSEGESKVSTGKSVGSGTSASKDAAAPGAESGEAASGGAVMAPSQAGARYEPLSATLTVEDQMLGRGKTFTLKACNTSSAAVTREFGSSQRYDFEVSQDGKLVWRWSDDMVFTQVVGSETWKAKECKEWTETWDATTSEGGRAPAGDYQVVGILKGSPELRTGAETFSVTAI